MTSFGKAFEHQDEQNCRSRVLLPNDRCYGDGCYEWKDDDQSALEKNADAIEPGDTYDEPTGGGSTNNDTGYLLRHSRLLRYTRIFMTS
uniref:Uncharacterized protein n=1 Tax=Ciona savignyi TaxID=51511 RepID=H2ZAN5_CIOSA